MALSNLLNLLNQGKCHFGTMLIKKVLGGMFQLACNFIPFHLMICAEIFLMFCSRGEHHLHVLRP